MLNNKRKSLGEYENESDYLENQTDSHIQPFLSVTPNH